MALFKYRQNLTTIPDEYPVCGIVLIPENLYYCPVEEHSKEYLPPCCIIRETGHTFEKKIWFGFVVVYAFASLPTRPSTNSSPIRTIRPLSASGVRNPSSSSGSFLCRVSPFLFAFHCSFRKRTAVAGWPREQHMGSSSA